MCRRSAMAFLGLFVLSGALWAADRTVTGKLVEVDIEDKAVTIKNDAGKTVEYAIGTTSIVMDSKGKSNFGFKDARLKPGATVKVVLPEKGNTIKELHYVSAAPPASTKTPPKTEAMKGAARKTDPPAKGSTTTTPPAESSKSDTKKSDDTVVEKKETTNPAKKDVAAKDEKKETAHDADKGLAYKITSIDKAKRTFSGEAVEGGKKASFTLDDKVEFVGPRGGVSDDDFDDDRFVVGNIVQVEMDKGGRNVAKVHLPYRKRTSK